MSQPVPFDSKSFKCEGAAPQSGLRQGLLELRHPFQREWTHAWVLCWQAQWKDSQSQGADGGYSGLVTWDGEEIQRNNLSMPNTHSQWCTGAELTRMHAQYKHIDRNSLKHWDESINHSKKRVIWCAGNGCFLIYKNPKWWNTRGGG